MPILGLTISGALCIGVTLLEHGLTAGIVVAIAIIALVQIEGNLLQPLIMSRAVHIHPLAVALAVAAGTTLDGVVGALIAVPLAAFTNSFVRALRSRAGRSGRRRRVGGPRPGIGCTPSGGVDLPCTRFGSQRLRRRTRPRS